MEYQRTSPGYYTNSHFVQNIEKLYPKKKKHIHTRESQKEDQKPHSSSKSFTLTSPVAGRPPTSPGVVFRCPPGIFTWTTSRVPFPRVTEREYFHPLSASCARFSVPSFLPSFLLHSFFLDQFARFFMLRVSFLFTSWPFTGTSSRQCGAPRTSTARCTLFMHMHILYLDYYYTYFLVLLIFVTRTSSPKETQKQGDRDV